MNSKTVGLILGGLALGSAILPLQAQMATTLSAPTNVSPASGSTLTPSQFTLADWTDVTGSSTPITYRYESSLSSSTNPDGSFTSPIYQSGTLTSSQISTSGTSPGTYFWHARAVDNTGATSTWSAPWSVTVTSGTSTPTTTPPSGNYYPNANPSVWYILPGQQLSFSGSGFAPNETVTIQGDSINTSVMADGSGHLTANNVLTIPYSWANSQHTFTLTGSTSDGNVTPRPITIQVGTFYPQLSPSNWWIGYSQSMSASVTGFAPGEQVKFIVNGNQVAQTAADGSGNVTFNFTTPGSGGTANLTAQGLSSGLSASQTIYLHS